jgi:hypothetical protein
MKISPLNLVFTGFKSHRLTFVFIFFPLVIYSQNFLGVPAGSGKGGAATTILKNWEAIGINPANMGWKENKTLSLGVFNSIGINIQTPDVEIKKMFDGILHPNDSLSADDKVAFADFFTKDNGTSIQTHVNWVAVSLQLPKLGGLAVNLRDRTFTHFHFNANLADVLLNGINAEAYDSLATALQISDFTDGTQISFIHYRECNIAYGRKIISMGSIDLFAGLGYKRLWGLGYADIEINGDIFNAQTSLSSRYNVNQPDSNFTIQDVDNLFNNVGSGNAFDFGINAVIKEMFKFGMAFTDIGSIKWTDNVMIAYDTLVPQLDSSMTGMESFQVNDAMQILFGENGMIRFKEGNSFSTEMPARMRLGAGFKFRKLFELAADVVIPLNQAAVGNIENVYYALGGEINIIGTLKVHTGIAGSKDYGYAIPLGVGFGTFGVLEFSIATNDVLTWIGQSAHPNASLILGVLRVNLF